MLAFTFAVSLATGLLFGLVPALQSTRPALAVTLKDQAGAVAGGSSVLLRKGLVVAQVALSLLLLIGAGLFLQSLKNLQGLDPGFRVGGLLTFQIDPTINGYSRERSLDFYRRLSERAAAIPGVSSAALAVMPVLGDGTWDSGVTVEGYGSKPAELTDPHMQFASPGFFTTLGIPILAGRDFTVQDDKSAAKVAIVNEKFARRYLAGANPIGRRVGMGVGRGVKADIEIVGVVKDTKYENMRAEEPFELYRPYLQVDFVTGMNLYARTHGDPAALFPAMRQAVREVDAGVPIFGMRTLEQQVDRSLVTERLLATLSSVFGLLATLLAAIGLYGVMAYMVARRTREIGIRMALGATGGSVRWLVLREVMLLAAVGLGIGLPAAWALTRLVEAQLFGIHAIDAVIMAIGVAGIAGVSLIAGYFPARRATAIDPMRALRWE
ncbi:MAG TPA: FtsX-like permease family protein [Bryobacteraceae bacterium]